jgi:hypothetical protein
VRHDLVKHAAWTARDLAATGRAPTPADHEALRRLLRSLPDEEGRPVGPLAAWFGLVAAEDAPPGLADTPAFADFSRAVAAVQDVADDDSPDTAAADLAAVLALEPAFEALARAVRGTPST